MEAAANNISTHAFLHVDLHSSHLIPYIGRPQARDKPEANLSANADKSYRYSVLTNNITA